MNEIQKFKEDRKIPKGRYGLKSHEILGGRINGMPVAYVNIPGKGYIAVDQKGNAYTSITDNKQGKALAFQQIKLSDYDRYHIYKAATRNDGMTSFGTAQASRIANYWTKQGAPKPRVTSTIKLTTTPEDNQETSSNTTTGTTTGTRTRTGTEKYRKNVIKRKITPKGQEYWNSQYQTFLDNMTDDQKAWLKQQGIDYSTAQRMQGYLSGMGEDIGNTGMDNKWGSNSQKAWENFVNTTMKNNPLQTPVEEPEPVVDSPDPFGYKTSNTYEADNFVNKVKALGIRSNADLMHFMYESGKEGWKGDEWTTQFRNDVDRALGSDYSDANIRKVFKTQGKWGIGFTGRGDFGDFQNALQTNTGLWNGAHDQKELASRTDSDGNVYSTSNAAKAFDKYSISSKIADIKKYKFPDLNFNLKQGNIGISTLGNQPGMFDVANYEGVV